MKPLKTIMKPFKKLRKGANKIKIAIAKPFTATSTPSGQICGVSSAAIKEAGEFIKINGHHALTQEIMAEIIAKHKNDIKIISYVHEVGNPEKKMRKLSKNVEDQRSKLSESFKLLTETEDALLTSSLINSDDVNQAVIDKHRSMLRNVREELAMAEEVLNTIDTELNQAVDAMIGNIEEHMPGSSLSIGEAIRKIETLTDTGGQQLEETATSSQGADGGDAGTPKDIVGRHFG